MDTYVNGQECGSDERTFRQQLERLVLDSYAAGVPVEGTWEIPVPVTDAPDWTISVAKNDTEEESSYQPTLLEE